MKHEYATDYLYFNDASIPSVTKGEKAVLVFAKRDDLNTEIKRRARAVLGMRGVKGAERVCLNTTRLRDRIPLETTNERLAEIACEIADETLYYTIQYV